MRFAIALLATLALPIVGCGKKESSAPKTAPAAAPDATAAPERAQSAPPVAGAQKQASEAVAGAVDAFLTSQLRIFIHQNGRLPKDFAEFARARLDSVPRTPAGTRWAIDPTTQEVKLVKNQ